jgi:hypothetical protein
VTFLGPFSGRARRRGRRRCLRLCGGHGRLRDVDAEDRTRRDHLSWEAVATVGRQWGKSAARHHASLRGLLNLTTPMVVFIGDFVWAVVYTHFAVPRLAQCPRVDPRAALLAAAAADLDPGGDAGARGRAAGTGDGGGADGAGWRIFPQCAVRRWPRAGLLATARSSGPTSASSRGERLLNVPRGLRRRCFRVSPPHTSSSPASAVRTLSRPQSLFRFPVVALLERDEQVIGRPSHIAIRSASATTSSGSSRNCVRQCLTCWLLESGAIAHEGATASSFVSRQA